MSMSERQDKVSVWAGDTPGEERKKDLKMVGNCGFGFVGEISQREDVEGEEKEIVWNLERYLGKDEGVVYKEGVQP